MKSQLLAVVAAIGLAGCVNLLPQPQVPSALITLPADRATAPPDALQADVAVFMPETSRAFAGADIAVSSEEKLIYMPDVRWSDAAPALLQGAVVNALSKAQGPGHAVPGQLGAQTDYDVRWRIIDLSAGAGMAPVHIEVQVSLMNSGTRRTIAQQTFALQDTPADATPKARAAQLAIVSQKIADQIAAFVAKTVTPKPAPGAPR